MPLPKVDADFYRAQQEDSAPDAHHLESSARRSLLQMKQPQPQPASWRLLRQTQEEGQIRTGSGELRGAAGGAKEGGMRRFGEAAAAASRQLLGDKGLPGESHCVSFTERQV